MLCHREPLITRHLLPKAKRMRFKDLAKNGQYLANRLAVVTP
jgi:hypothetical protein